MRRSSGDIGSLPKEDPLRKALYIPPPGMPRTSLAGLLPFSGLAEKTGPQIYAYFYRYNA
jgi:hypothetical protein